MKLPKAIAAAASLYCCLGQTPSHETVQVIAREAGRTVKLPGELLPYQQVDIHARVPGFVEKIDVDRGSAVRKGQLLAVLSAPEMQAQLVEARSKVQSAEATRADAQARLVAAESTLSRLREAAATPGAVAANEITLAEKAVESARGQVAAAEGGIHAAQASVRMISEMLEYLRVTAPFDGLVTDRLVHPGALAGPTTGPLLRIEQTARLRLLIPVPEADAGSIPRGIGITFTVPAFPGQTFRGTVARVARSFDPKTRALTVEADVANPKGLLAPGMFPEVSWPVERGKPSLLAPPTAVVTTTERSFVIRVNRDGKAEWVDVRKGAKSGDLVEVVGALSPGDAVVKRASDEIRPGTPLRK